MSVSDDELLAEGSALERRLREIDAEADLLAPQVEAEGHKLRRAWIRLTISSGGAVGGAVAAPWTMGWSLLLTLAPVVSAALDVHEQVHDAARVRQIKMQLRSLRDEATRIRERLDEIWTELQARAQ